jgi:hypothetical protein
MEGKKLEPTARNIIFKWCQEYKEDPKKYLKPGILRIIAYAVRVGQYIGIQQSKDALHAIKDEPKEEGEAGGISEATIID